MDPKKAEDRQKLFKALKRSHQTLRPFRETREQLVRDYCGSHYSQNGPAQEILINYLQIHATATTMNLTANRPQVMVSTDFIELESFAKRFEAATNNAIKEMRLEETLEQWVLDAYFALGILKVFMAPIGPVEFKGLWIDPGKPFAERVSLDNFLYDTQAVSWDRIRFAGDWFEVDYEEVKANPDYDPKVVELLDPERRAPHEMSGESLVRELSQNGEPDYSDGLNQPVRLMELWLPKENLIVTWPFSFNESEPLQVREWDGPEYGPYHLLSFDDVPDNIMPVGLAQRIKPLHDLFNNLLRKQRAQAKRQKDVTIYEPDAAEDAKRVGKAADGDMVRVQRAESIRTLKQGGVDAGNQAFSMRVQELLNQAGGNISAMAGLGPQSGTVGQDELIHGAVSRLEARMKQRTLRATARVCQSLGWMVWVDKVRHVQIKRHVEGFDFPIVSLWTPEEREGDWLQYNFEVEPHSMEYRSSEEKAQQLLNVLERAIAPLLPQIAAGGGMLDPAEYVQMLAELFDAPQLTRILRFDGPTAFERPGPAGDPPRQAPHTVRENIRRNIPTGGTEQSRNHTLMQTLLGGAANQDQMAALSREPA